MKIKECLKLSFYDIKMKKSQHFRFFLNILFISTITSLLGIFVFAIQRNYSDLINNQISMSYVAHYLDLDKDGKIIHNEEYELSKMLEKHNLVKGILRYAEIDLLDFLEKENWNFLSISHVNMKIDRKSFQGVDDYSYDFIDEKLPYQMDESIYSVPFGLSAVELSEQFEPPMIIKEFSYRYSKEKIVSYGRYLKNENEVMISEYMLNCFGIYDNYENYIGKKISFRVDGKNVLDNYVLVGIFNSNFFRVNANNTRNQIWITGSSSIYKKYKCVFLKEQACTESFPQLTCLEEELEKIGNGYFWDNGEREEYEFIEKMKQIIEKVIYIIVLIVIVAVLLNLVNHIYTDMQESAAFYGMLRAMGICPKKVYLLIMIREGIMITFTFLFSVLLVGIGVRGIGFLMKQIFFMNIEITVSDYLNSILIVFCGTVCIISMITYLCYYRLLKNKIADNLKVY